MPKLSDEWQTPQWLYDELNNEFHFDVDLCATFENRKINQYYRDYLTNDLVQTRGMFIKNLVEGEKPIETAFMNPPYSNPRSFIEKAWQDSKDFRIVCLLKVDPSTKWWAIFWDYEKHMPKPGGSIRFLPKRIKFIRPDGTKAGAANFASCVVIMDRRGQNDLCCT